ncbi:MAG: hypothetical protein AAGA53_14815 [Pseudomonadota bacterium]
MTFANILFFIIIFGVGFAVLIHLSQTLSLAGKKANETKTARNLIISLWGWAALAIAYALVAGRGFLWFAPSLLLPLCLVVGSTFTRPVAILLEHASVPRLVGVQVYRIAGSVFLMSYFWFDSYLSREFAMRAGWGDVLTGLLAIPVAYAAWKRIRYWRLYVFGWCILGIIDLIVAPMTAQMFGGPRSDDFPINSIPIFFGPPLGIGLHLVTLRALWLQSLGSKSS